MTCQVRCKKRLIVKGLSKLNNQVKLNIKSKIRFQDTQSWKITGHFYTSLGILRERLQYLFIYLISFTALSKSSFEKIISNNQVLKKILKPEKSSNLNGP